MIVPLFGMDVSGKSVNVNAQERLNLYTEFRLDPDKTAMVLYQTPGLLDFLDLGNFPIRGLYEVGDFLYVAQRFNLYKINNAGTIVVAGTLSTESGYVSMTDNGLQLLAVDGTDGYVYNFSSGAFSPGSGMSFFPPNPTTCTFQGGTFLVSEGGSGRFFKSALYDGLTWNSLDFATAETNPDKLVTVIADHGEVVLFGEITTEFWGNTGNVSFPFALIQGTAMEWGLAARQAVAKFDNSLVFLGRNRQGQTQVVLVAGHNPQRISTHELESKFEDYPTVADATCFSYMLDGHAMFQINFTSGGESWLYDGASSAVAGTPIWSRVQSFGLARHRIDRVVVYLNRLLGADYRNGRLYRLKHNVHTEAGDPIVSRVRTRHHFEHDHAITVGQVWLDAETGVGTQSNPPDQGAAPRVMFRYSKDHGHTWSAELWRDLGGAGQRNVRCLWNRLGASLDWVFEWSITDPVKRVFLNAGLRTRSSRPRVVGAD